MATSSKEFAELVNKLHQTPNDPTLKKAVVEHLPKMMSLAQNNPLALYHLAHIYAPNSPQYQQTMRQAANLGCTNAMLVMCQVLGKSNNPNEVKKAAHYLTMINKSDDSYIKEQAEKLVKENPQLAKTQHHEQSNLGYIHTHRFFTSKQEKTVDLEQIEAIACKS